VVDVFLLALQVEQSCCFVFKARFLIHQQREEKETERRRREELNQLLTKNQINNNTSPSSSLLTVINPLSFSLFLSLSFVIFFIAPRLEPCQDVKELLNGSRERVN